MYLDMYREARTLVADSYLYDHDIYTTSLPLFVGTHAVNIVINGNRLVSAEIIGSVWRGTHRQPPGLHSTFTWEGYPDEGGDLASEIDIWTDGFERSLVADDEEHADLDTAFDNAYLQIFRQDGDILLRAVKRDGDW